MATLLFLQDELRKHGALPDSMPANQNPITLDNEVHPIFRIENWSRREWELFLLTNATAKVINHARREDRTALRADLMTATKQGTQAMDIWLNKHINYDESDFRNLDRDAISPLDAGIWERLQPALQLASHLLNLSLPFLYKMRHADSILLQPYDYPRRPRAYVLTDLPDPTPEQLELFAKELQEEIPQRMLFFTGDCRGRSALMMTTYLGHKSKDYPFLIGVQIDHSFVDFVRAADWDNKSLGDKKRFFFHFAYTLVHELAHATRLVNADQNFMDIPGEAFVSPANLDDQEVAEIGHEWSMYVFGGNVRGLGLNEDLGHIWCPRNNDEDDDRELMLGGIVEGGHAISEASISRLFEKTTWPSAPDQSPTNGNTTTTTTTTTTTILTPPPPIRLDLAPPRGRIPLTVEEGHARADRVYYQVLEGAAQGKYDWSLVRGALGT